MGLMQRRNFCVFVAVCFDFYCFWVDDGAVDCGCLLAFCPGVLGSSILMIFVLMV